MIFSSVMKSRILLISSFLVLFAATLIVWSSTRSSLFTLQVIEVANHPENAPVSAETVSDLTALTVGRASLLSLDLQKIEKNVLSNPWIKKVNLQKRLPETLVVSVEFREPKALLQRSDGAMSYVDREGIQFGPVASTRQRDLPLFLGFKSAHTTEVSQLLKEAVEFTEKWEKAESGKLSQISALSWDSDKGFRASLIYKMKDSQRIGRATLEVGQLSSSLQDSTWRMMDANLGKVLRYLSSQSIAVHQIFVGDGKKIVVKTARGS